VAYWVLPRGQSEPGLLISLLLLVLPAIPYGIAPGDTIAGILCWTTPDNHACAEQVAARTTKGGFSRGSDSVEAHYFALAVFLAVVRFVGFVAGGSVDPPAESVRACSGESAPAASHASVSNLGYRICRPTRIQRGPLPLQRHALSVAWLTPRNSASSLTVRRSSSLLVTPYSAITTISPKSPLVSSS
jgi:hypothetical protein